MKLQWKNVHVESHTSTTVVETPNLQMQKMSHYRKAVMNRKVRRRQKGLVVPLECFLPPSFPEQFQPLRRLLSL